MVDTVRVNADHGRNFHLLADHTTQLHEFSAFPCSLHVMLDQALSNLIVCLMISQTLHTNVAQTI